MKFSEKVDTRSVKRFTLKPEPIRYLKPEEIEQACKRLGSGTVVTTGEYRFPAICSVEDLDWNHMDQDHRPWIHHTYEKSMRIFTSADTALSLCNMSLGPFRFQVLLTDIRLGPGLFYQCYTIFNLFYIHGMLKNDEQNMVFKWRIASHWLLKPFHRIFGRMLYNLNHRQIAEDVPLRERRKSLRQKGFHFHGDGSDYLQSNSSQWATAYPSFAESFSFSISAFPLDEEKKIAAGPIELIVRKISGSRVRVWPEVCPHGGGPLASARICKDSNEIQCPWHGQKIPVAELGPDNPQQIWNNLLLSLRGEILAVSSTFKSQGPLS